MIHHITTEHLEIAYEEAGARNGRPVVAVHGWPDDVRCWDAVAPQLVSAGCRVLAPYLRGSGLTRFRSPQTMRSGAIAALGQDLAHFIEAHDLNDVIVAGYDWGARAGYAVAALIPERLRGLVAMSAGYATSVPIEKMSYALSQAYWYEWFVATKRGREAFEKDRRRLCRYLWQNWSPHWTFTEEEFAASAPSLDNPDWVEISIHAYLQRWGEQPGAPEHEAIEQRLASAPAIRVPTLVLHGAEDRDNFPETSEGKEQYFLSGYERSVIPRAGHFLPREVPNEVARAVLRFLQDPQLSAQ